MFDIYVVLLELLHLSTYLIVDWTIQGNTGRPFSFSDQISLAAV